MNQSDIHLSQAAVGMNQPSILFVGTGNIAQAHAQAVRAAGVGRIAAVVDTNAAAAERFARQYEVPAVHRDLAAALAAADADVVHVLTPPDSHAALIEQIARAGRSVFAEKPVCTRPEQLRALRALALPAGVQVGVNQNFCFHPAFVALTEAVGTHRYGRLRHLEAVFHPALRQLAARQFTHWMFASPLNLLLEQAVHPLSQLLALMGDFDRIDVQAGQPVRLSEAAGFVPEMTVALRSAQGLSAGFHFAVGASYPAWRLTAYFDDGIVMADMVTGTVQHLARTRYLDAVDHAVSIGRSALAWAGGGLRNLTDYARSQVGLKGRSDAFFLSVLGSVRHFYAARAGRTPLLSDLRFGADLVEACMRISDALPALQPAAASMPGSIAAPGSVPVAASTSAPASPPVAVSMSVPASTPAAASIAGSASTPAAASMSGPGPVPAPAAMPAARTRVLVIGGTGFIGKPTVRRLAEAGHAVRVMARSPRNLGPEFCAPGIELVRGDVKSAADIDRAMQGVDYVVNLAHGGGGASYEEVRAAMVDSALAVARAAAAHGARRLVHVGSVAGLYLGEPSEVITGSTPPDPQPEVRGDYARAKAVADQALADACRRAGLSFVILRPGVVVGEGTSPLHSALGLFNNDQHVIGWGRGDNPLPFVLADDVAQATVAALTAPQADGRSYNLAGDVPMSAREFTAELARHQRRPIRFHRSSPRALWAVELGKWAIKRVGGRKPPVPSIREFRSRQMAARFDCSDAKRDLGWTPVADRDTFVSRAIAVHG